MAFNISYIYEIVNKASVPLKKIAEAQKAVAKGAAIAAARVKKFGAALGRIKDKAKAAGDKLKSLGSSMSLKVTAPLLAIGGFALKSSAALETLETSFESMLGSADKARVIVKELVDFTAKTPFQLEGVGKAGKQLLAFGVAEKDILPTLQVLGDIAAGANVPLTEMSAIFGKVKAKGKAYTEELLQMSDRGIPIIDILAKRFGVTKQAVFDAASSGKISFKIIQDAMQEMTQKGGIFFKQMDRQSATLAGIFSTLKDNINLAMAEVGDTLVETLDLKQLLKDLITGIQSATKAFAEFAKNNPRLVKFGLIITGIVIVLGPLIGFIGLMVAGFAFLSGPVLAVMAAFALLTTGIATFFAFKDDVIAFFNDVSSSAIATAAPIIEIWDNITASISGAMSTITTGIQAAKGFFGIGDESKAREREVRAPGAQELNGRLGIDINLAGNTDAAESVTARPIGNGNLGMNMAVAQ